MPGIRLLVHVLGIDQVVVLLLALGKLTLSSRGRTTLQSFTSGNFLFTFSDVVKVVTPDILANMLLRLCSRATLGRFVRACDFFLRVGDLGDCFGIEFASVDTRVLVIDLVIGQIVGGLAAIIVLVRSSIVTLSATLQVLRINQHGSGTGLESKFTFVNILWAAAVGPPLTGPSEPVIFFSPSVISDSVWLLMG